MSSDDRSPDSPASWILYAHSDLELARTEKSPSVLFETLVFHAQQAAEKALKAVLIAKAVSFPRTHSIPDPTQPYTVGDNYASRGS